MEILAKVYDVFAQIAEKISEFIGGIEVLDAVDALYVNIGLIVIGLLFAFFGARIWNALVRIVCFAGGLFAGKALFPVLAAKIEFLNSIPYGEWILGAIIGIIAFILGKKFFTVAVFVAAVALAQQYLAPKMVELAPDLGAIGDYLVIAAAVIVAFLFAYALLVVLKILLSTGLGVGCIVTGIMSFGFSFINADKPLVGVIIFGVITLISLIANIAGAAKKKD